MSTNDRPLSPHISIYRWPITMALSILHRATGIAMSIGLVVMAAWLVSAAAGAADYARFEDLMSGLLGRLLLVGWSLAFFFHFFNGIRHLVWDTGRGFSKPQANASSYIVLAATVVATAALWMVLL